MVRMNFQVDSPAAWAAEYHNCTLLQRNVSVEKHLLESADATCQLLRSCSEETHAKLCELITENGLGGESVLSATGEFARVPALLPPQGVLKVLACVKDVGHDACTMPTAWHHDGRDMLHLQKHSAKAPVKFFVAQLEAMEETNGLAWLQAMNVTSESQCTESKDVLGLFDQELAKTAWEVGQITALPKVLRILGHWKSGMPQILLDALLASHRMELMRLMELTPEHSLGDTFSGVKALTAALDDASDLCFVSLALNLAENLEDLQVNCFKCNDFGKVPSAKAWSQLSSQIAKAKIQYLRVENFIVTDPGKLVHQAKSLKSLNLVANKLTTIPKEAFSGLSKLETLDLGGNQIPELPKEAFSGLSKLEKLYLQSNKLTTIPNEIFTALPKLELLSLGYNKLTELPQEVFSGLSNLRTLHLYGNQLTELPKEVFSGLSHLEDLNLMENELTKLPKEVFGGLSKLESLYLWGNHLEKDDIPGLSNLLARGVAIRI